MKSSRILLFGAILCTICLTSCSSNERAPAEQSMDGTGKAGDAGPPTVHQRTVRTAYDAVALFPESGIFEFADSTAL